MTPKINLNTLLFRNINW